ncbi:MAG: LD-carboxypeptidase [Burkholderia sp.]|jgi:muramoyltetrapeptide carboxypeptidase
MNERPFKGKTLVVTAPSRQWVRETGGIDWDLRRQAFAAAEALGFDVVELETTMLEEKRFAGSDAERARDFVSALTEVPGDAVMALRGGYGASRILDLIDDWGALAKTKRPVIGYSDFTALSLALLTSGMRATWQGPTLRDLIDPAPLTIAGLETALGMRPLDVAWDTGFSGSLGVSGTLWGGNLSVMTSLAGTFWMPHVEDGILFIEDVGEAAYRIERMLLTLDMSGATFRQKAILVGQMTGADRAVGWKGDFSLSDALAYIAERTGIPVITGLPFGHVHEKCALPVGQKVRLTVSGGRARLQGE